MHTNSHTFAELAAAGPTVTDDELAAVSGGAMKLSPTSKPAVIDPSYTLRVYPF